MSLKAFVIIGILLAGGAWGQNTWTPRSSGTSNNLNAVLWTGERLVAVGDSGKILASLDGIFWGALNSGVSSTLNAAAWGDGRTVVVGDGVILTSTDGSTWTAQSSGPSSLSGNPPNVLTAVAWSDSQFVAVGLFGAILTSPDGLVWTARQSGSTGYNFMSVTWMGTQWAASAEYGHILLSPDGADWSRKVYVNNGFPVHPRSLVWTGTRLVAFNGNEFMSSPDGATWTYLNIGTLNSASPLMGLVWTGYRFVAVGPKNRVATSRDGVAWAKPSIGSEGHLSSIAWTGNLLVAVGQYGVVFTSSMDSVVALARPARSGKSGGMHLRREAGQLKIDLSGSPARVPVDIRIVDLAGRTRAEVRGAVGSESSVPIGFLEAGVYGVEASGPGIKSVRHFVTP